MSISKSTATRSIVAQLSEEPAFSANRDELSFHFRNNSRLGCGVMRWTSVMFVSAVALGIAGLEGCGGKVVIDAAGSGGGGSGGAGGGGSAGFGGSSTSTSSGGNSCVEGTCSQTPDGSCACAGTCNGTEVSATCFATNGSLSCACIIAGTVSAKCESPVNTFGCDVKAGCCAEFFP